MDTSSNRDAANLDTYRYGNAASHRFPASDQNAYALTLISLR